MPFNNLCGEGSGEGGVKLGYHTPALPRGDVPEEICVLGLIGRGHDLAYDRPEMGHPTRALRQACTGTLLRHGDKQAGLT